MLAFREIPDNEPALKLSPLLQAVLKLCEYAVEHDGIALTQTMAFKRTVVHWAAEEFNWPNYTKEHLYRYNKVLNELDLFPLYVIHEVMLLLKLGRHYKKKFRLTKMGRDLYQHPGKLFKTLIPFFLLELDHSALARGDEPYLGKHDIIYNIINHEAESGISSPDLRQFLYGEPEQPEDGRYQVDHLLWAINSQILRPLTWAGLLQGAEDDMQSKYSEKVYFKTEFWRQALVLDDDLPPRTEFH